MNITNMINGGNKTVPIIGDILTPEDKSSLRNFAQKIHKMDTVEVARLHNGMADKLTSEQKDIVAYEIKLREYYILKSKGIDPKKDFSVENIHNGSAAFATDGSQIKVNQIDYDRTDPRCIQSAAYEQTLLSEMSDEILERSKKIIENAYIPVKTSELHEKNGGGVNAMFKKYVAIDDNGNKVKVNNEMIQEKFRKNYLKTLSDITGIDYTVMDEDFYKDFSPMEINIRDENNQNNTSNHNKVDSIDMSDYEDIDEEDDF